MTHGNNIECNLCVFAWRLNTQYSDSVITLLQRKIRIGKALKDATRSPECSLKLFNV